MSDPKITLESLNGNIQALMTQMNAMSKDIRDIIAKYDAKHEDTLGKVEEWIPNLDA